MRKWLASFLILANSQWAMASGLLVFDASSFAQLVAQIEEMKRHYGMLQDQYDTAKNQLQQAEDINNNLTGKNPFGELLNSESDLRTKRKWTESRWDDALNGLSGGNPDRKRRLEALYDKRTPTIDKAQFVEGGTPEREKQWKQYEQQIELNRTAQLHAGYAYEEINDRYDEVYKLAKEISKQETTKESIDLNSRLQIESAYIALEQLKMLTILNQQLAQEQADSILAETKSASFTRLPDANELPRE